MAGSLADWPVASRPSGFSVIPAVYASAIAATGIAMAVSVLIGLWIDIPALKTVVPGLAGMKANTATAMLLSFAALLLLSLERIGPRQRGAARWGAALVVLIGAATLFEYGSGINLGIDELLVRDDVDAVVTFAPGRMGANTALNFVLTGAALLALRRQASSVVLFSQCCALLALGIAFTVLLGYIFSITALTGRMSYTPMALHTAIGFVAAALGILILGRSGGFMAEILSVYLGGMLARRLLPVVIVVIPAAGWIRVQGQNLAYFGTELGTALFAAFNVVVLSTVIVLTARGLNRIGRAQQKMVADLSESEQRFRSLADNVPGVVYQQVVMPDGARQISYVGSNVTDIFGEDVSPERVRADADLLRSRIHPDDRERILALREVAGRDTVRFDLENRIVRTDGQVRWIHTLSQPRRQPDGGVIWDGLVIDITDRKMAEAGQAALEQQLRQAQKMEAVGQLTGGVAHDFNNLLTVILGNSDALLDQIGDRQPALRAFAERTNQAALRASMLTQRLLAFSRRQVLQPAVFDLNQVVSGMGDMLHRTLGETIEIETVLAGALWPVLADKSQVESALINLAVNARDAMQDGGKLTIESANVRLDDAYAAANVEVKAGPYAMLAVTDTGTGMAPDVIEHAFEPFFTTKEAGEGTGLGLSMIFGFAKQSGGHVKIYSEVGYGTTVKLYLPRARANGAPMADESHELPVGTAHGERILVVEDDPDVRAVAVGMLTKLGYHVIVAADGPSALVEIDKGQPIDLLFTDVVMPGGMTGRQLANEAQRRRPGLKVLFTSGYTQNSIVHHGRLDDGVELIGKPYRSADLARKIAAMLAPAIKAVSRP